MPPETDGVMPYPLMPMASYLRSVIAYYIEAGSLLSGFVKYSPNADKRTCYVSARESRLFHLG